MKPLWPHQAFGLSELDRVIAEGARRICLTSPTGGGKSRILFEHLAARPSAAVYTDRKMLMQQLSGGLSDNGFQFGLRAAGHEPRLLDDLQLCMVQTEASRVAKGREVHPCEYVYIDELHKNGGPTMQGLLERHRQAKADCVTIGFTATPLGIEHMADVLIVAGTNSELRKCGALVPAYHYGPDEPDTKWIGKVKVDEGECGIPNEKRMEFAHRVFGRVAENYAILNPDGLPAILFAPGVAESIWFAKTLTEAGIPAAHIDGKNCWLDGEEYKNDSDIRDEIARRSENGEIKIVCNRFVLREGIDWTWLYHGIFATVFGSLTSYIQAGGRILRAHPGLDHVVFQDHGGNWHRHGSLNTDREWNLEFNDRIVSGLREQRLRTKKDPEPITCPRCHAIRVSGAECFACGYRHTTKSRIVLQKDGTLREVRGDIFRRRRYLDPEQKITKEWSSRVRAVRNSKKATVQSMTFAQLEASFARDHNWLYPPREMESMPIRDIDFYRKVSEVPMERLRA